MIEIINSEYKGNDLVEIHVDGKKIISFGKRKAQALVEAFKDDKSRFQIETLSGHARSAREQEQANLETVNRVSELPSTREKFFNEKYLSKEL